MTEKNAEGGLATAKKNPPPIKSYLIDKDLEAAAGGTFLGEQSTVIM